MVVVKRKGTTRDIQRKRIRKDKKPGGFSFGGIDFTKEGNIKKVRTQKGHQLRQQTTRNFGKGSVERRNSGPSQRNITGLSGVIDRRATGTNQPFDQEQFVRNRIAQQTLLPESEQVQTLQPLQTLDPRIQSEGALLSEQPITSDISTLTGEPFVTDPQEDLGSGEASEVTPGDLLSVLPLGGAGIGLSDDALRAAGRVGLGEATEKAGKRALKNAERSIDKFLKNKDVVKATGARMEAAGIGSTAKLEKAVGDNFSYRMAKNIVTDLSPKRLATKTKVAIGLGAAGILGTGASAVISADILLSWYALDNVADGAKFFSNDMVRDAQNGEIDPREALRLIEEQQYAVDLAKEKAEATASRNPLVVGYSALIKAGLSNSQTVINQNKIQLQNMLPENRNFSDPGDQLVPNQ